ncbi:alpha/beta hydrolase [Agromyces seonyuensis]|uniref:Alpha/beta fold hydrolase n=1 Tax=Agromyces seonyuensis TaxID=2662446 RepID=A0A6I4NVN9_9MICO|nr:alpha/beta hydrolase [Agromyces seonyuensis]MWB97172.1 alpha/beta fold hydrolase [Agromyces seonyuensis]
MAEEERTATLAEWEAAEVAAANAAGGVPVVFIHGLWLLSESWRAWRDLFEDSGYATLAPGWPDDPPTVAEAREHPEVFARKMVQQVTDHYLGAIALLDRGPVVIGHSFGGLIAQKIAGTGAAAATVSIDNAPFKGVLPLPASTLKSSSPVLGNPANARRGVQLTLEQFKYGWANALDDAEAEELYERFHVPAAGAPLFQAAFANFNPFGGETEVDSKNPARGPLLLIGGAADHTVPPAITNASYKIQSRNPGITEEILIPDRGHSLTIDHGWREVADEALAFVQRHAPADG